MLMPHTENHHRARLVLDTNVWLDWLVFADAGVAPIQHAVASGAAIIFISPPCLTEVTRVLGYSLSGRTLDAQAQAAALAQIQAVVQPLEHGHASHTIDALPRCDDPDDQMFLQLARDCRADAIITQDRDLLALATRKVKPLPFRIITPREFALDALRC